MSDLDDEELEATRRLNGVAKESEIEDDIKILEDWLKELDDFFEKTRINNTKERNALRNVLAEHNHNITRIKELEQKESILDKVIDKLKEIKRELNDDGFGYYAQEVTKTLNIIEGENNNGNV